MTPNNQVEVAFHDFIAEFGGEVLPEPTDTKIADYFFRKQNIVAELKCLMIDQTEAMNSKLTPVVLAWIKEHGQPPPGYDGEYLKIGEAPKEISDVWLDILKTPLEGVVKDANRQIRDTKERLNTPDAKGLLLVFNQGNQLHTRPHDFKKLIVSVLQK